MNSIIGKWSQYLYNGYGTMEDTLIAFLPDGSGWSAFECLGGGELCTFSWRLSEQNLLDVQWSKYFELNEKWQPVEPGRKADWDDDKEVLIAVQLETLASGERVEVLSFNTVVSGCTTKFALLSREEDALNRTKSAA